MSGEPQHFVPPRSQNKTGAQWLLHAGQETDLMFDSDTIAQTGNFGNRDWQMELLRLRCVQLRERVLAGELTLLDAVDLADSAASISGLCKGCGADAVQEVLSQAFLIAEAGGSLMLSPTASGPPWLSDPLHGGMSAEAAHKSWEAGQARDQQITYQPAKATHPTIRCARDLRLKEFRPKHREKAMHYNSF